MPHIIEIVRIAIIAAFILVLTTAAVSDIRRRTIPNWSVVAIVLLFIVWAMVGPSVSLLGSLGAAMLMLLITIPLYAFRVIGAGDSKLIAAVALFVGWPHLPQFLLMTALAGGVIAIISLLLDPRHATVLLQTGLRAGMGRGVPYGVAIALAGVFSLLTAVGPGFLS
jgi:prepilin peptidase CpaA